MWEMTACQGLCERSPYVKVCAIGHCMSRPARKVTVSQDLWDKSLYAKVCERGHRKSCSVRKVTLSVGLWGRLLRVKALTEVALCERTRSHNQSYWERTLYVKVREGIYYFKAGERYNSICQRREGESFTQSLSRPTSAYSSTLCVGCSRRWICYTERQ